ncbi:MAG: glycosyltransferase [Ignavibacteria bacterium]
MKVSVWMTAYNHGKYISACLDSVLNQKTDFDFEIVLGEDCSADNTREIVKEYADKYPGKFKLFLPEKNIGMMEMDVATHGLCSGEYLALLNGDDYWTDESKLQIQVDFLEENKDAVMCYHKALVINDDTGYEFETVYPESGEELTAEFLLKGYNPVMTPTVMVRNVVSIPEFYSGMPYGDMLLYLLLSQKGKLRYIDRLMSVYRIHSNGQWQGETVYNNILKDLKFYEVMNKELNFKYDDSIRKIFAQRYFDLILADIKNNNKESALNYMNKLEQTDKEFLDKNTDDINILKNILNDAESMEVHAELLNREPKWKVN